jgi:hypothetical protein
MSTVVFLAPARDTTTTTTVYGTDHVASIADEAMVRLFNSQGKCALVGADVRSIRVTPIAATTATVNWVVDVACTGMLVNFGTTTAYGSTQNATPTAGTGAIVANLTGLTTATLYHYRVSVTVGTAVTLSPDQTFTTA